jgi:hypothetical protein
MWSVEGGPLRLRRLPLQGIGFKVKMGDGTEKMGRGIMRILVLKKVGVVRAVTSFQLLKKSVMNKEVGIFTGVRRQRDTAGSIGRVLKEGGAVRTAMFFQPLKKSVMNEEASIFIIVKRQRDTAGRVVRVLKEDGAVRTVTFFQPLKRSVMNEEVGTSTVVKKPRSTAKDLV